MLNGTEVPQEDELVSSVTTEDEVVEADSTSWSRVTNSNASGTEAMDDKRPEVGSESEEEAKAKVGLDPESETTDDWDDWDDNELGPSLAEELEAATHSVRDAAEQQESETDKQAETDTEIEIEKDRHWYVVHCYSGYENKVRHNLEQRIESMEMRDQIFDVIVPTEDEIEVRDGKRKTVERRVFPGYILVQMNLSEESWYVVRNTPGVTGFVGMGNTPLPLPETEVAQIMNRMEAEAPRIRVTFKTDQKVRIVDGPFNDFIGTVSDIDMDRAKVRVMVSFFGRETPVELDFLQIEKT